MLLCRARDTRRAWADAVSTAASANGLASPSFSSSETINSVFHGNPFGVPDSLAVQACGSTRGCGPDATWAFWCR